MKITLIGATDIWAIENHYIKYLRETAELELNVISTSGLKYQSWWSRGLRKFFPNQNPVFSQFNQRVLAEIATIRPDVVLIFKGMELYPETLERLRSMGIKLANYNPDHPFLHVSKGSGNRNVIESVSKYDLHISYSQQIIHEIRRRYNIPCAYLPFGFELSVQDYETTKSIPEVNRICFIGNPDSKRKESIEFLLLNGLPVDVYGHGWSRFLDQARFPNLHIHPPVYGMEFWNNLRRYRVQLNLLREHNFGSHNMRSIEIPAVGGVMLAMDSEAHNALFTDQKEAFYYKNDHELLTNANKLLNLTLNESSSIRNTARNRSLINDYSYRTNTRNLIKYLQNI